MKLTLTPFVGGTNLCLGACDHCLARLGGANLLPHKPWGNILALAFDTLLSRGKLESVRPY